MTDLIHITIPGRPITKKNHGRIVNCGGNAVSFLLDLIKKAPTVDAVEVVHGRWVVEHEESVRCSECCFNRAQ